ncbi:MAG: methyltransferase, partial [Trueperaceae bacterium]|nr:methyltransferase [Trueperaceae bacterium]
LRRGRVRPPAGGGGTGGRVRALDLTGAPAAMPLWAAAAGVDADWTVALSSAAALVAAREAPGVGPGAEPGAGAALMAALPWEVPGPFDWIVWRPPADRGVRRVRAELAAVAAALAPGGMAVLAQHKDEGAQRCEREAATVFGEVATVERASGWRVSELRGPRLGAQVDPWVTFEPPADAGAGGPARALAGAFAAEKLDPGSAVLLRVLAAHRAGGAGVAAGGARVLDLGCGTGLLARAALAAGAREVVALDDDLAAVRSASAQLAGDPRAAVVHADLLRPVDPAQAPQLAAGGFDEVWCNPPFHVGRQVVGALSRAFVAAAHEALRPGGVAWFVVNRALPYERELLGWGGHADVTPEGERSFTVWRASRGG